jgi:hypothetical protein
MRRFRLQGVEEISTLIALVAASVRVVADATFHFEKTIGKETRVDWTVWLHGLAINSLVQLEHGTKAIQSHFIILYRRLGGVNWRAKEGREVEPGL